MNTTRSTSRPAAEAAKRVEYTVIGGPRWDRVRKYPYGLTLLVLSRGDRLFRPELLTDLEARRLGEVVWVEGSEPSPDIESLSHDHPEVRFLLVKGKTTAGELVNIGIAEARAPLVLCFWSDMRISRFPDRAAADIEKSRALCTLAVCRTSRLQPVPTWQSPVWKRRRLSIAFRIPRRDGERTLFPFDYCGVYDKEKFTQAGGFDPAIENPYWQKLDFGFRCHLWGEKLLGTTEITLLYTDSPPEDDATPDQSYKIFFLKNLAVRTKQELGFLPGRRLLDYIMNSGTGPLAAVREFRAVRDWVRTHRFRFRRDPRDLIDQWEES